MMLLWVTQLIKHVFQRTHQRCISNLTLFKKPNSIIKYIKNKRQKPSKMTPKMTPKMAPRSAPKWHQEAPQMGCLLGALWGGGLGGPKAYKTNAKPSISGTCQARRTESAQWNVALHMQNHWGQKKMAQADPKLAPCCFSHLRSSKTLFEINSKHMRMKAKNNPQKWKIWRKYTKTMMPLKKTAVSNRTTKHGPGTNAIMAKYELNRHQNTSNKNDRKTKKETRKRKRRHAHNDNNQKSKTKKK